MLIKNFCLFWREDEVDWYPGQGNNGFRLLDRQGKNKGTVRLTDFRPQVGIYILYSDYGPYYTGLTTEQGLGKRLKDHLEDGHAGKWDRFSWFGFRSVLNDVDQAGLRRLRNLARVTVGKPETVIRDTEALLIRAMGLINIAKTRFYEADEWFQVKEHETESFLAKVMPGGSG